MWQHFSFIVCLFGLNKCSQDSSKIFAIARGLNQNKDKGTNLPSDLAQLIIEQWIQNPKTYPN